ncbi:uncharacterized protein SCHCODRAFT_01282209 [Schizophyllum commune H4-8]|nr:uncharacterized protein SCHCODRAFT_01282209 [Schizophyllum commune H4-8]KAI5895065.1 hypothetical protein SCHCODRAFT_01282209 [Schizophyllum commune H4-8]
MTLYQAYSPEENGSGTSHANSSDTNSTSTTERFAGSGTITRIPDEVLAIVFFYYAVSLHDSLYTRAWTCTLLRINRHWRELALHTPILWSFFSSWTLDSTDLGEKQLRLSYAHPLSLKLSPAISSQIDRAFAILEPHKEHVHDVEVNAEALMIEYISLRLRQNWKNLRHLSLWSANFRHDMPAHVAQYLIPGLRTLRLINVRLDWTFVRHVLHLRLGGSSELGSITINALSDVLRSCPTLQTLELFDCVYRGLHEPNKVHRPAELPQLRRFYIRASVDVCASVMGLMSLPSTAAILIVVNGTTDAICARPLLVQLSRHLHARGRSPPKLRSLQFIATCPVKGYAVNCWMRFMTESCLPFVFNKGAEAIVETTQLELRLVIPNARGLRRVVTKALNVVRAPNVEALDVRFSTYMPTGTLRALLHGLAAVRSIYLTSRTVSVSVFQSVRYLIEDGNLQGPTCAPYKKPLRLPTPQQIFWDTRTLGGADRPVAGDAGREIVKLLEAYESMGMPIQQVLVSQRPDMSAQIFEEMTMKLGDGFVCPGLT